MRASCTWCAVCTALLSHVNGAFAQIDFDPTWQIPSYFEVRSQVVEWVEAETDSDRLDPTKLEEIRRHWPEERPEPWAALDAVVHAASIVDRHAADLIAECSRPSANNQLPDIAWIEQAELPPIISHNLKLFYGRWLVQNDLFDEAIELLEPLKPADVVDPAALLFYRAVSHHQLVQPDRARADIATLLERESELPQRYFQIAKLLERDLATVKDESLDHIARRMEDIRRRLHIGRAGDRVQDIERGVIESLDKLIERAEQQQQQQQQAQGGQPSGSPGSLQPMQDSMLPSMKAPGKVDRRQRGNQTGWGDLPPRQREQALQQIGRDFPAHYRSVIEQYFRELASEPENANR